jgi:hypothetical protein
MDRSYPWDELDALGAGSAVFVTLQHGHAHRLEPNDADTLPAPFRDQLQHDGFDLGHPIVVSRDLEMIDGFTFTQ